MTKTQFDDQLKRLRRELRKLEGTETPIARRNARARVLTAARLLRAAVDKSYPPIVNRTGVKRLKTIHGRIVRLEAAGWSLLDWRGVSISDSHAMRSAGVFAAAGVPVKRIVGQSRDGHRSWAVLVPKWAKAIGEDPVQLRAAKKSLKLRNAAIVAEALATP